MTPHQRVPSVPPNVVAVRHMRRVIDFIEKAGIPQKEAINILSFSLMSLLGIICAWSSWYPIFCTLNIFGGVYFAADFVSILRSKRNTRARNILLLHHLCGFLSTLAVCLDQRLQSQYLLEMASEMNSLFLILRKNFRSTAVEWGHTISWYVMRLGGMLMAFVVAWYDVLRGKLVWNASLVALYTLHGILFLIQLYWHKEFFLKGKYSLLDI